MKLSNFFVFLCGLVLVVCSPSSVFAQDAKTDLVVAQCSQLHTNLKELEARDLVSRTNMGREYENIDKQISAFTERVQNNNYNNQSFLDLQTQYKSAVNQFRAAYVQYDDSINELIAIDCQSKPSDFLTTLDKTKTLRTAVNDKVTSVSSILSQYREQMVQLQNNVPSQNSGGSQ